MKVYDACSALLRLVHMPGPTEDAKLIKLVYAMNGHQWLFGFDVTKYIDGLIDRSEEIAKKKELTLDGLDDGQKLELALGYYEKNKENFLEDAKALDSVFSPYMNLKH